MDAERTLAISLVGQKVADFARKNSVLISGLKWACVTEVDSITDHRFLTELIAKTLPTLDASSSWIPTSSFMELAEKEGFFNGFDEVWFSNQESPQRPRLPGILSGDSVLVEGALMPQFNNLLLEARCVLAFGDGVVFNCIGMGAIIKKLNIPGISSQ